MYHFLRLFQHRIVKKIIFFLAIYTTKRYILRNPKKTVKKRTLFMNIGDKFEAQIEKIVFGGDAFCKAPDGMVVFVANALDGEKLLLEIK